MRCVYPEETLSVLKVPDSDCVQRLHASHSQAASSQFFHLLCEVGIAIILSSQMRRHRHTTVRDTQLVDGRASHHSLAPEPGLIQWDVTEARGMGADCKGGSQGGTLPGKLENAK